MAEHPCTDQETTFADESCYRLRGGSSQEDYSGAKSWCSDNGYHLPVVTSDAERSFLRSLTPDDNTFFWTDATKADGQWTWGNGEPLSAVTDWIHSSGSTFGVERTCLVFRPSGNPDHCLSPRLCAQTHRVICERPLWPVCTSDAQCGHGTCNGYGSCVCSLGWEKGSDQTCSEELFSTTAKQSTDATTHQTTQDTTTQTEQQSTSPASTDQQTTQGAITQPEVQSTGPTTTDQQTVQYTTTQLGQTSTGPSTKQQTTQDATTQPDTQSTVTTDQPTTQDAATQAEITTTATTEAPVDTTPDFTTPSSAPVGQTTAGATTADVGTTVPEITQPATYSSDSTYESCNSNPCRNEGTCTSGDGAYHCRCAFGYKGTHCEIELYPDADYSTLRHKIEPTNLLDTPAENPRVNPFYELAAYYGTLEGKYMSPQPSSASAQIVKGRGSIGEYYRLISPRAWLNPMYGTHGGTCVEEGLAGCERGFALSLWVLLGPEAADLGESVILHAGTSVADDDTHHAVIFIDADKRMKFRVNNGSHLWTVTVPTRSLPLGAWFNLAFTWRPASGLAAYINSGRVGSLDVAQSESSLSTVTPSPATPPPWEVTIGGRGQRASTSPLTVSDLVIWDRFLFDIERHRYLGITAEELQVLLGADFLWSTDGYLRRDHSALQALPGMAATGDILSPSGPQLVPGRDSKGWALDVDGAANRWLALGDEFTGKYVSDPALCPEGITFALWVKLRPPISSNNRSFAFIFSSGGQSSRGCALFQRGQDKLRAVVADGWREWIVEIQFVPDEDHWVHIAMSWSQSSGLILYINGDNHGMDRRGLVRLRHEDLDTRLLVGRRNDYLAGYSHFVLEQLAIWERFIEPWQARREFGLIANSHYATSTHFWDQTKLVSSTYGLLVDSASKEFTIGPSLDVEVSATDSVDLSIAGSHVVLGDYRGRCVSDPHQCGPGLSVSLWLRFSKDGLTSEMWAVIISSGGGRLWRKGFAAFVKSDTLVVLVVSSTERWHARTPTEDLPNDVWINLAFTWSAVEELTLYIDGNQPRGVSYFYTNGSFANNKPELAIGAPVTPWRTHFPSFHIHNLAIWESYVHPDKVNQLLGMSKSELHCFQSGDYCWSFENPLEVRHPFQLSPTGAAFTSDRNHQETAICTDGHSGWVSLGDFTGQCPAVPSACENGFAIAMWVKLKKVTSHKRSGYLLSAGAEVHGESGVSLLQSLSGIQVKVVDSKHSWLTQIDSSWLTFDRWIYLGIIWSGQHLTVSINGQELPTITRVHLSYLRGGSGRFSHGPKLTLGKSIHGSRGFVSACYDEVLLVRPKVGEDLPSSRTLTSSAVHSLPEEMTNHLELDRLGPETAKPSCRVIHEADCARNVEELLLVVESEIALTDEAVLSSTGRLDRLTKSGTRLSSSELHAATKVIKRLADRDLPQSMEDTEAEIYLADFLEVVNNLLLSEHTKDWISTQSTKAGTTSLMDSVETLASDVAHRLKNNNSQTSVTEVLVNRSHIFMAIEVTPMDYLNTQENLVIPRYGDVQQWKNIEKKWQNLDDRIAVPNGLFDSASNTTGSAKASFTFTMYDSIQGMIPVVATNDFAKVEGKSLRVISRILSLKVEPAIQGRLDKPFVITLSHQTPVTDSASENPVCAFWNFYVPHTINGAWDREGCELQSTSETYTVCHCYHLTHFAVVVEPQPDEVPDENAVILRWLVRCLVGLSVCLLLVLIITYIVSKRVHTLRHSIHLNLCLACLLALVVFALSEFTSQNEVLCLASGASMHFLYLAAIMWLTMETFQLYRDTTVGGMEISDTVKGFAVWRNRMIFYMLGGWGIPAVIVGSVFAVSRQAYKPQAYDLCWLEESHGMPWSFDAPCCLAFCMSIFVLIMVIRSTDGVVRNLDRTTGFRSGVRATCLLTLWFAATWLVGSKAIYGGPLWTSYTFVFLNSLLGLCVFILQGFGNVEVRALLCRDDPDLELALVRQVPMPVEKFSVPDEKPNYLSTVVA